MALQLPFGLPETALQCSEVLVHHVLESIKLISDLLIAFSYQFEYFLVRFNVVPIKAIYAFADGTAPGVVVDLRKEVPVKFLGDWRLAAESDYETYQREDLRPDHDRHP